MTTLHEYSGKEPMRIGNRAPRQAASAERRRHRRHDLETRRIRIERWDSRKRAGQPLGEIVDLSSGGVRIRTASRDIQPDNQIRVRMELPAYAGICPFVDTAAGQVKGKTEWIGWMSVARIREIDENTVEVGARLLDMGEMDRGMLGLYLSTQPLAA